MREDTRREGRDGRDGRDRQAGPSSPKAEELGSDGAGKGPEEDDLLPLCRVCSVTAERRFNLKYTRRDTGDMRTNIFPGHTCPGRDRLISTFLES